MSSKYVGVGEEKARGHQPARRAAAPVRLEFVVRPPLGAGPRPGSGRPNGHCSARHGPPMWPPAKVNSVWSFNDAWLRTSWSEARRQAPRNGASSLDAARVLGIRDAQVAPPALDTHGGLVTPARRIWRARTAPPRPQSVALDPAPDGRVVRLRAAHAEPRRGRAERE